MQIEGNRLMWLLHACAGGYRIDVNLFGKKHRSGTHQYERVHTPSVSAKPEAWLHARGGMC
jgi:hypothetical protein